MTRHRYTRRSFLQLSLGSGLICALPAALAHGEKSHSEKAAATQTPAEQTAWGIAGTRPDRTIDLRMSDDMRFTPDHLNVKLGETLRLRLKNTGAVMHELVIGTAQTLAEHAETMLKFPTMEHSEPYMAHVPPGKTGEIVWTFNRAGNFEFACLVAGHYQAGMRGTITVQSAFKEKT